jgi:HlyD family secretion protein
VETSVDEADIGQVRAGQRVRFTVDAYPGVGFSGSVSQIRLQPVTESGVVTYTVVIRTRNEDLRLRPGMTAEVTILTAQVEDAIRVPNVALRILASDLGLEPESDADSSTSVWLLKEGRPVRVVVLAGLTDGSNTALRDGNLRPGDEVITGIESPGTAGSSTRPLGGLGPPSGMGRKRG